MNTLSGPESVLIAVDVSDSMETLLAAAKALATEFDARINVVHAFDPSRAGRDPLREEQRARGALRDAITRMLPGEAAPAEVHTFTGGPAEIVLREADRLGVSMIVLGPHRNLGNRDKFLGSTAEAVLRFATVPCLVLNAPLTLPIAEIVAPTDFSTPARRALAAALAWSSAGRSPVRVTLAHVAGAPSHLTGDAGLESDLETELRSLAGETSSATGTRLLRNADDPAGALINLASESGAGLIAVGTSGAGTLTRAFLGSLSSELLRRADRPLLLVPPPIEDRPA
jgi:nucleotide-binding universal stress UspA family protein